jgi:flavin-dependent dehydrogenase
MGVDVPAWGPRPFIGIRYVDGDVVAEGRFPNRPGFGVRRTALVDGLVARARALGADLRYGCPSGAWRRDANGVELATDGGAIRARLLVGADGLRSAVRKRAGLERPARGRRRFGVRRHYRVTPWSPFVEVHWSERAEAYVTPAGPGRVGVAMLWDGDGSSFDDLLRRFPQLERRLDGAAHDSGDAPAPAAAAAPPARGATASRVGDAAGYLDALTGEGLTLAFRQRPRARRRRGARRPLAEYERLYRRLSRTTTCSPASCCGSPRIRRSGGA